MRISDWSSDVCSSDLDGALPDAVPCKIAFFSARDLNRGTFEFLQQMGFSLEVPDSGEVGLLAGGITFTPEMTDTLRRGAEDARSEEHTSELQSLMRISYAVFCLKKKTENNKQKH